MWLCGFIKWAIGQLFIITIILLFIINHLLSSVFFIMYSQTFFWMIIEKTVSTTGNAAYIIKNNDALKLTRR